MHLHNKHLSFLSHYERKNVNYELQNYEQLTLSPRSKISSAFGPLTVQWTAIFSLRRIPKERTVYLALEKTGV